MLQFIIEQFNNEFHTSRSGLAQDRLCINRFGNLSQQIALKK
ncbi:hypothetical protein [Desulfolithobacter sp.]